MGDSVRASVWDNVGASVRASVWASVGDNVRASVRASVGASVRASVGASVGDSVRASVRDNVGASVRASVWDSVRASVGDSAFGQHDAALVCFYQYFREQCGLTAQTEKFSGIREVCESAGWFLPHAKICWVAERHNVLNLNSDGRLHNESGIALAYPDGWGIWALNGVRVDEQIVMRPETQALKQIDNEKNEEVRRLRIERFGWPRYIAESNADCIDSRRNDIDGTTEALVRLKDGSVRLLCACRSTGRTYAVGVLREIATCEQAQVWMAGGSSVSASRKFNVIGAS